MPILEINKILGDLYNIDINLTNNQIRKLKRKGHWNLNNLETIELENNVKQNNGIVRIKEDEIDGEKIRTAILVIDPDEYENLKSDKGNPMFIDGTAVPNRLNWELTMITLGDQYLGIQPGGSMFSINSNKEIFDWFLEQILDLLKDKYQITMITDEDLSLSSSIDSYNLANEEKTQINHVLCSWHKTRNFEKKLNECKLDESTKERIRFCWKRICYSPKKGIVLSCIDEIKQLNYTLTIT